jgi:hypothetical protein
VCFGSSNSVLLIQQRVRDVILVYILSHQAAELRMTSHERLTVLIRKASCKKGLLTYHYGYHYSLLPVVIPDVKIPSYFVVLLLVYRATS